MTQPQPYVFSLAGPRFGIDPAALYGFWDREDGSEGGGLWFGRLASGALDLIDFDGAAYLPHTIVDDLRSAGVVVSDDFT